MSRPKLPRGIAALASLLLVGFLALSPLSASAALTTSIAFQSKSPMTAAFGDDWTIVLITEGQGWESPPGPLRPTDGTVDVYVSGIGGTYASALPIQLDGTVYFSQPAAQPLLAAGTYDVTAIFNPGSGSGYDSSQTATPLSLTITPVKLTPTVSLTTDPVVSEYPVITAALSGEYVDKTGGAPSGTWQFTLVGPDDEVVFETEVPQEAGSTEPVQVEVTPKLEKGATYTLNSTFVPVAELAPGIAIDEIAPAIYTTPSGSFLDVLSAPLPFSWWLLALLLLILVGLAVTAILLGVKLSNRSPKVAAPAEKAPAGIPGDPEYVELMTWEEAGIHDEETKAFAAQTTWSLGAESAEAPTEALPTGSAAPDTVAEPTDDDKPAEPTDEELPKS